MIDDHTDDDVDDDGDADDHDDAADDDDDDDAPCCNCFPGHFWPSLLQRQLVKENCPYSGSAN